MAPDTALPPLVEPSWLAAHLSDPDVVAIDASWYMPAQARSGAAEYARAHIPGAVFFDIDAISDHTTALPHMLPSPAEFARAVGGLGIDESMTAVVYDGAGIFSAPRVWWMLRLFGMRRVAVLDGGLPAWTAAGLPDDDRPVTRPVRPFRASQAPGVAVDLAHVRHVLEAGTHHVVDARSAERFEGRVAEPRPGLASGHMPGSLNLPSSDLVAHGRMKPAEDLARLLDASGVDGSRPVVTSCGSGVSAATITLALARLGRDQGSLYDGSWTEWGGRPDLPVATGPAARTAK
jgi:thiosulfate/3-mercaptopyruvate sulfurtransferase